MALNRNFNDIDDKQKLVEQVLNLLGFGVLAVLLLLRIGVVFSYDPEITGIDNNFVYTVLRMLAGYSPYPDPEKFPYVGNIYSPLYFDLCYLTGKIVSVNPNEPIQVFRLTRSISLIADFTTTALVYSIIKKNYNQPKAWAAFGAGFFATILCYLAYTFNRADSLFLTFYTLVFYCLTKPSPNTRQSSILLMSFLSVCAVFTKQNGIILPALIAAWFFVTNERKKILPFLGSYVATFLVFYLTYTFVIGYDYLYAFAIRGIQNKVDPNWFYLYIFKPFANSVLLIPISFGIALSVNFIASKKRPPEFKALAIVFLIQTVFSTASAFKWGSSLGYYNESFVLAFICIAVYGKSNGLYSKAQAVFAGLLMPMYLAFSLHVIAQTYLFFIGKQPEKKLYYTHQQDVKNYIQPLLQGKHILDLDGANRNFFKHFFYSSMAAPHFDTIDCCLLPDGTFDYTNLRAELTSGSIRYIIFTKNAPRKEIWGVSLNRYVKDTTIHQYDIYRFQ